VLSYKKKLKEKSKVAKEHFQKWEQAQGAEKQTKNALASIKEERRMIAHEMDKERKETEYKLM